MAPLAVTRHLTPAAFLSVAGSLLRRREAECGLMLAISSGWARRGELPTGHQVYLATVGSEREPEAAALMRVPHNVILTHASNEAVQVLAEDLDRAGLPVPGAHAPGQTGRDLRRAWCRARGVTHRLTKTLRILELTRVMAGRRAPGQFRQAQEGANWSGWLFGSRHPGRRPGATRRAKRGWRSSGLTSRRPGSSCGIAAGPSSMASATGATPDGIRVSAVYMRRRSTGGEDTPPRAWRR